MDLISTAGKPYFSNPALSSSNKLQLPEKIWWPFLSVYAEQARGDHDLVQHVNMLPSTMGQDRTSMASRLPQLVAFRGSINSAQTVYIQPLLTDGQNYLPLYHGAGGWHWYVSTFSLPLTRNSFTSIKRCSLNICSSFICSFISYHPSTPTSVGSQFKSFKHCHHCFFPIYNAL